MVAAHLTPPFDIPDTAVRPCVCQTNPHLVYGPDGTQDGCGGVKMPPPSFSLFSCVFDAQPVQTRAGCDLTATKCFKRPKTTFTAEKIKTL